jgi:hypothetical protein
VNEVSEQDNKSPKLSLPDRIFGRSVEGAMERVLDKDRKEKHKEVEALLQQIDKSLQTWNAAKNKFVPRPVRAVILVCLGLGSICILSTIVKSWVSTPNQLDWGILCAGLLLCGLSLFKEFRVGKGGLSAKLKDYADVLQNTKTVIGNLLAKD